MSYPGGFSKHRIGDRGTQRMASGEDNVGSRVDEEPPSTLSREVLSCADAIEVITWLRPVGESKADAFWKKFSFPPYVRVSFSSSRPQFAAYTDGDRGVMNPIYWSKIHISKGLRFPLHPLIQ